MKSIRVSDVAVKFSVSVKTVWNWTKNSDFPKPYRIQGATFWVEEDLDNWVREQQEKRHGSSSRSESQKESVRSDV